jgi:hypothetical protein
MKSLTVKFGRLITASFVVMASGILLFIISIPLYIHSGIDLDIFGFIIFTIGLAIGVIGLIRRKQLRGAKLILLAILVAALLLPVLSLVVSLVYYAITRKPLGG